MTDFRTHYDNLQIKPNASDAVIRAAYRALSQAHHPDRNPDDVERSTRRMRIINQAYSVLSDPEARARHDAWIEEQAEEAEKASRPPSPKPKTANAAATAPTNSGSFDQTWKDIGNRRPPSKVAQTRERPASEQRGHSGNSQPEAAVRIGIRLFHVLLACIAGGWLLTLASKTYQDSGLANKAAIELIFSGYFVGLFVFRTGLLMAAAIIVWIVCWVFRGTRRRASIISGIVTCIIWWFLFTNPDGFRRPDVQPVPESPPVGAAPWVNKRYDDTVKELEARYPAINPDSPAYDKAVVRALWERKAALEMQGIPSEVAVRQAAEEYYAAK